MEMEALKTLLMIASEMRSTKVFFTIVYYMKFY